MAPRADTAKRPSFKLSTIPLSALWPNLKWTVSNHLTKRAVSYNGLQSGPTGFKHSTGPNFHKKWSPVFTFRLHIAPSFYRSVNERNQSYHKCIFTHTDMWWASVVIKGLPPIACGPACQSVPVSNHVCVPFFNDGNFASTKFFAVKL